jgi:hypothetical protein
MIGYSEFIINKIGILFIFTNGFIFPEKLLTNDGD